MSHFVNLTKVEHDDVQRARKGRRAKSIIALMGKTKAGKSTFIDTFTGCSNLRSHSRERIREVQKTRDINWDGEKVMLVELPAFPNALPSDAEICRRIAEWETPGFQNEPPSDTELLRDIARFLVDSSSYYEVAGIIYLYDLSTPLEAEENEDITNGPDEDENYGLAMMCGIAGDKYHGRLKLVLNKFEPITNLEPETRVERLTRLWSEHVRGGNAPILSYNPQTTPSAIIQSLLCHETATTLALQRELLEDGRLLRKTTAGTRISAQLAKIKKQVEARKKELKNEMKRLPVNDPQRFIKLARMQALTRRRDILDKELKAWKKSKVKFQRE